MTPQQIRDRIAELEEELAREKVANEGGKIQINGSFGKFGEKHSILYAPDLLLQVTLTGQLSLLMLIEAIEEAGIPVVSANTDGIVIKCPKARKDELNAIIERWEERCGYKTEETLYRALYSRDVNSYVAVYANPKDPSEPVKTKGDYAKADLMRNAPRQICLDAVIEYLVNGTPMMDTIRACRDITKFTLIRTVKGGAVKNGMYLGKAVRWVYAKGEQGGIHYLNNGNLVPQTIGAVPMMELPDEFPEYLDYDWYYKEALEMLRDCGALPKPVRMLQRNVRFLKAAIAFSV